VSVIVKVPTIGIQCTKCGHQEQVEIYSVTTKGFTEAQGAAILMARLHRCKQDDHGIQS
jgi:hypothetical protein